MRKTIFTILFLASGAIATSLLAKPPVATRPQEPAVDELVNAAVYDDNVYRALEFVYARESAKFEGLLRDPKTDKMVVRPLDELDASEREASDKLGKQIEQARRTMQSAKSSESERGEAKKLLGEYLELQFENDMTVRQEQLKAIEAQLEELRSQLQKRRDAKPKLIEMKLAMMENEAAGLGFPESWNQRSFPRGILPAVPAVPAVPTGR